jgi:hypothetical protein
LYAAALYAAALHAAALYAAALHAAALYAAALYAAILGFSNTAHCSDLQPTVNAAVADGIDRRLRLDRQPASSFGVFCTRRTYRGAILHLQVRRASVCARTHIPLSDGVQRRVCVRVHVRSAYSLLCVLSRAWLCMPVHT